MSDMKCPVCNKQMKIGTLDTDDGMGTVWMSIMPCDCVCSYGASKAVWQELIRTHKALGIAVDALEYIRRTNPISFHFEAIEKALEQITAEQKEHFADTSKKIKQKD